MDEQKELLLQGADIAQSEERDISIDKALEKAKELTESICSTKSIKKDWARHAIENFDNPIKLTFKNL